MSIYMPSLTDDEMLRYADQAAVTDIEKELVKRYNALYDNAEGICYVEEFKASIWEIAKNLENTEERNCRAVSEELFAAIVKFEEAQR